MTGQQKEIFNMRLLFEKKYLKYAPIELFETKKTLGNRILCPFFDFCIFLKECIFLAFFCNSQQGFQKACYYLDPLVHVQS